MPSVAASPAVSVVMPVHDGERFLREALDSVLAQTLSDFELVVVDDGSTDGTSAILAEYAARDPRIVVHRQANAGGPEARNRAFRIASAPLVANMDADDVASPTRLERQVDFLTRHREAAVVGGAVAFVEAHGREFGEWRYPTSDAEIRAAFGHTTPLAHPATTVRKAAFLEAGGYRPVLAPAEDIDLWARLGERHALANLPDVVVRYRVHPGQETVRDCEVQALGALAARVAARARADGRPDPVDGLDRLDVDALRRMGATDGEIASAVVHTMTWVARTLGRAGYQSDSERLFLDAGRRARGDQGSRELVRHVHRQQARLHREQGRRVAYAVAALRAAGAGVAARASRRR